jgi:glyoxylase-like metal-dependent hydrolase (beta-lactamase superfamily II)
LLLPPEGDEVKRPPSELEAVIDGAHSCLVVGLDGRWVLIDGSLDATVVFTGLREIDVDRADIDLVLITHGDTDHIGGLLNEDRTLVYPNATYVLHPQLWEAWTSDGERGDPDPFYEERQRQIARLLAEQIERSVLLREGHGEIAPGVRAIASPGHRPSHLAYELVSGERRLLHVGDALIAPVFVDEPSRGNAFDSDPALGIRSRIALLREAARPQTLTYVPHFPFPGFARITEREDRFAYASFDRLAETA